MIDVRISPHGWRDYPGRVVVVLDPDRAMGEYPYWVVSPRADFEDDYLPASDVADWDLMTPRSDVEQTLDSYSRRAVDAEARCRLLVRVPCISDEAAQQFANWLRSEDVNVTAVDGRIVIVPTTYPPFAWEMAGCAVELGHAEDGEACRAVVRFLGGLGL